MPQQLDLSGASKGLSSLIASFGKGDARRNRQTNKRLIDAFNNNTEVEPQAEQQTNINNRTARRSGETNRRDGNSITDNLQPGDIITLGGTYNATHGLPTTHAAIYAGNGNIVHRTSANRPVSMDSLSRYNPDQIVAVKRSEQGSAIAAEARRRVGSHHNQGVRAQCANFVNGVCQSAGVDTGGNDLAHSISTSDRLQTVFSNF